MNCGTMNLNIAELAKNILSMIAIIVSVAGTLLLFSMIDDNCVPVGGVIFSFSKLVPFDGAISYL